MDLPGHEGHLLILLVVLVFAAWVGLAAHRPTAQPDAARPAREDGAGPPARILAAASLLAGLAHAVAAPHHVAESALYGAFFVAVTLGQFAYAGAVIGPGRRSIPFLLAAMAANAVVLATWIVSRTAGLPVGPHRTPEAIGPVDLTAAVAEMLLICLGAVWLAVRISAPQPQPEPERVRSAFPS